MTNLIKHKCNGVKVLFKSVMKDFIGNMMNHKCNGVKSLFKSLMKDLIKNFDAT